jgi:hypothetical protein
MNERIKELLNQATTDALYETKDAIDFLDNPVSKQQRELQLEKFAELIVAECLSMCDETQAVYYKHRLASLNFTDKNRYAAGETAADTIYTKIKLHFGVEE